MIAFASVFLGLIVGVLPVTVLVGGSVATVRFELDGKSVGQIEAAPWSLPIDFGAELLPHELIARGFNREGEELGRVRQFVNLPQPLAEVGVLLERDARGIPVAARFSSQIAERPSRARATFDGKPLAVQASTRVKLPAYDASTRHILSVELEFSAAVRSRADVVLGLGEGEVASSELMAVAVRSKSPRKFRQVAELSGTLLHDGRALPIVAVDDGSALVCVVREPSTYLATQSLALGTSTNEHRYDATFEKEDRVRIIWPVPRPVPEAAGAAVYDRSRDFKRNDGGMLWLLTGVAYPKPSGPQLRLADAAAVAGLEASASGSRRSVVLVLGDKNSDGSRDAPAVVRRYLAAIRVPLFVWSLKDPVTQPLRRDWGNVEDVSSATLLEQAVDRLKRDLSSQRIIWVKGRYLPQDITLSETAIDLEFVR